jgi:hypothetical protein
MGTLFESLKHWGALPGLCERVFEDPVPEVLVLTIVYGLGGTPDSGILFRSKIGALTIPREIGGW